MSAEQRERAVYRVWDAIEPAVKAALATQPTEPIEYLSHRADPTTWFKDLLQVTVQQRTGKLAAPDVWGIDGIQFTRLLAEIRAIGLTPEQDAALCDAMDLDENRIAELFERAETAWTKIKDNLPRARRRKAVRS